MGKTSNNADNYIGVFNNSREIEDMYYYIFTLYLLYDSNKAWRKNQNQIHIKYEASVLLLTSYYAPLMYYLYTYHFNMVVTMYVVDSFLEIVIYFVTA